MKQKKVLFVIFIAFCIFCSVSVSMSFIDQNNTVSIETTTRDGVVCNLGKWRGRAIEGGIDIQAKIYDIQGFLRYVASINEYDEEFYFVEVDGTSVFYLFFEGRGFVLKVKNNTIRFYSMETTFTETRGFVIGDFCPENFSSIEGFAPGEWQSYAVSLDDIKMIYCKLNQETYKISNNYIYLKAYERVSSEEYKLTDDYVVMLYENEEGHVVMQKK